MSDMVERLSREELPVMIALFQRGNEQKKREYYEWITSRYSEHYANEVWYDAKHSYK